MSESTPLSGALTSTETLSVSSSTRLSSFFTRSPGFLSQRATVASVTDSPSAGTTISIMGMLQGRRFALCPKPAVLSRSERFVQKRFELLEVFGYKPGGCGGGGRTPDIARPLRGDV